MSAAPTESSPALGVAPPLTPTRPAPRRRLPAGAAATPGPRLWPATLAFAGGLCAIVFYAKGGLALETMAPTEIALTIAAGLALAAAALIARGGRPAYGLWPVLLLTALAVLSAISIIWSVQPDESWRDAGRMLAYSGVFAAAVVAARLAQTRWPAILGGIVLSSVVVCGYVLITKSLPDHFAGANVYARLYEPFGYWNALGLTAAMGAIGCMWLGARRSGHALLSALSYPAMGVLLLTLMLAYSRGALVALALGLVLWFAIVPLRLRGAAVLISSGVAAGAIVAWDFRTSALTADHPPIAEAVRAGHELGALTLAMVVVLTVVGVGVTFATGRRPPTAASRRRAGTALLGVLGLLVVLAIGALAASHRGLTGTISHDFNTLTDTHAKITNDPSRLTAVASVRAQYWDEALKVFSAHPALGTGADGYDVARLRYLTGPLAAKHAHGFIVQTLADLGLVGLVLVLALMLSWMAAAGRSTHPLNRSWGTWRELRATRRAAWRRIEGRSVARYTPERIGTLTMLCMVAVFGAHSLIDWTWYVPGDAIPALICAGWLAGRGPLATEAASLRREGSWLERMLPAGGPGSPRMGLAALAVLAALLIAFSQWQPLRAEEKSEAALGTLDSGNGAAARAQAAAAVTTDPLSTQALFVLAKIEREGGLMAGARATLARAVRLQPSNPTPWLELGRFDLASNPPAALKELQAGIYLNPGSISPAALATRTEAVEIYNDYIDALRASAASGAGVTSGSGQPGKAGGGGIQTPGR